MRIRDCIINAPMTGNCTVNIDKLVKCFGKSWLYVNRDGKYRFINNKCGIKIDIDKTTAEEIIRRMNLIGTPNPIFSNVISYRKSA